jgi:hypothetical protein
LSLSNELNEKLKIEIRHAENLKSRAEGDKEAFEELLNRKQKEIELITKSRDKSERHISFLVKEKDRLLTKSELNSNSEFLRKKEPSITLGVSKANKRGMHE